MKTVTILSLLLLASPAFSELTKEDLRIIIKEENAASEKRVKEYIDLKIDGVEKSLNARIDATNAKIDALDKSLNDKIDAVEKNLNDKIDALDKNLNARIDDVNEKFNRVWLVILGLIGLITAAIAVPQIIVAYRDRGQKEMEKRQDTLETELQVLREQLKKMPQ